MLTYYSLGYASAFGTYVSETQHTSKTAVNVSFNSSDTAGRPVSTYVADSFRTYRAETFYRSPSWCGVSSSSAVSNTNFLSNGTPFSTYQSNTFNGTSWNGTRTAATTMTGDGYGGFGITTSETTNSTGASVYSSATVTSSVTTSAQTTKTTTATSSRYAVSASSTTTETYSETITTSGATTGATLTSTTYATNTYFSQLVPLPVIVPHASEWAFRVTATTDKEGFPADVAASFTKYEPWTAVMVAQSYATAGEAATFTVTDTWYSTCTTTFTTTNFVSAALTRYPYAGAFVVSASTTEAVSLLQTTSTTCTWGSTITVTRELTGVTTSTNGITCRVPTWQAASITTQYNLTSTEVTTYHATFYTTVALTENYAPICVTTSTGTSSSGSVTMISADTSTSTHTHTTQTVVFGGISTLTSTLTSYTTASSVETVTSPSPALYSTNSSSQVCVLGYDQTDYHTYNQGSAGTVYETLVHNVTASEHTYFDERWTTITTYTTSGSTSVDTYTETYTSQSYTIYNVTVTHTETMTSSTASVTIGMYSETATTSGQLVIQFDNALPPAEYFDHNNYYSNDANGAQATVRFPGPGYLSPLSCAYSDGLYLNLSFGTLAFCYPFTADATRLTYTTTTGAGSSTTQTVAGVITPILYTGEVLYSTAEGTTSCVRFDTSDSKIHYTSYETSSSVTGTSTVTYQTSSSGTLSFTPSNYQDNYLVTVVRKTDDWSTAGGTPHVSAYAPRVLLFPGVHHFTLQREGSTLSSSSWFRTVGNITELTTLGVAFPIHSETTVAVAEERRGLYLTCGRRGESTFRTPIASDVSHEYAGGVFMPTVSNSIDSRLGWYYTWTDSAHGTMTNDALAFAEATQHSGRPLFAVSKYPDV